LATVLANFSKVGRLFFHLVTLVLADLGWPFAKNRLRHNNNGHFIFSIKLEHASLLRVTAAFVYFYDAIKG